MNLQKEVVNFFCVLFCTISTYKFSYWIHYIELQTMRKKQPTNNERYKVQLPKSSESPTQFIFYSSFVVFFLFCRFLFLLSLKRMKYSQLQRSDIVPNGKYMHTIAPAFLFSSYAHCLYDHFIPRNSPK